MKTKTLRSLSLRFTLLVLLSLLVGFTLLPAGLSSAEADPFSAIQARIAEQGSYRFTSQVDQTLLPRLTPENLGQTSDQVSMQVEGSVLPPDQAYLVIQFPGSGETIPELAILQKGQKAYIEVHGILEEIENPAAMVAPGGDALIWLNAAQNVMAAEPVETLAGTFERYTFDLDGERLAEMLIQQMRESEAIPANMSVAPTGIFAHLSGSGEIWLDAAGLPVRQILDLDVPDLTSSYAGEIHLVTDFRDYGLVREFPIAQSGADGELRLQFQPIPAPLVPVGFPIKGWLPLQLSPSSLIFFLFCLWLAFFIIFYRRYPRLVQTLVTGLMLLVLLFAPLLESLQIVRFQERQAQAAASARQQFETALGLPSQAEPLLANEGEPAANNRLATSPSPLETAALTSIPTAAQPSCGQGVPGADTDNDTLPDVSEYCLGTDPFASDSDRDMVPDATELNGVQLTSDGRIWPGNPFSVDTNQDGLADASEWPAPAGEAPAHDPDGDGIPNLWDDDNDGDGVLDGLDLSPFAYTQYNTKFSLSTSGTYTGTQYIEFQVRPETEAELRYSVSALDWPYDNQGQITDRDNSKEDLRLNPMLEIQTNTLPSAELLQRYGLVVFRPPNQTPRLMVPLNPTGDGTSITSFYGKVAYGPGEANNLNWKSMELVWVVTANLDRFVSNQYQTESTPVQTYRGSRFRLTGFQLTKTTGFEGGVFGFPAQPEDDRQLFNLLFGLSSAYLNSLGPSIQEIKTRFSNMSTEPDQRWGVTALAEVETFSAAHRDAGIAALSDRARSMLEGFYSASANPSLVLAWEEEIGNYSLDDTGSLQTGSSLTVHLANIHTNTTRSLKLGQYQHFASGWEAMSLEDSLEAVHQRYDSLDSDLNSLQASYPELSEPDLRSVLYLFYTAWLSGQTRVLSYSGTQLAPSAPGDAEITASLSSIDLASLPSYLIHVANLGQPGAGLRIGESPSADWQYLRDFGATAANLGLPASDYNGLFSSTNQTNSGLLSSIYVQGLKKVVTTTLAVRTAVQAVQWARAVENGVRVGSYTKMMNLNSRVLGVVGAIVAVTAIWVQFGLTTDFSNPIAVNLAVAYAVAATVFTIVLFVISLNPVGAVLVAIFALVDIICFFATSGSFSLSDTIIQAVASFFYDVEMLTEVEDMDFVNFNSEPKNKDTGIVAGSRFIVSDTFQGKIKRTSDGSEGDLHDSSITGKFTGSGTGVSAINKQYSASRSFHSSYMISTNGVEVEYILPNNPVRNQSLSVTSTIHAVTQYEECTLYFICWDSDYTQDFPADLDAKGRWGPVTFVIDVLPASLTGLITWSELTRLDTDGDGLNNDLEGPANLGTAAELWDTDGDGLSDYYEYRLQTEMGTNPLQADTDGDGLNDALEIRQKTAPDRADTDGDGLADSQEVFHQDASGNWTGGWSITLPGLSTSVPVFSNPSEADIDGDGMNDAAELANATSPFAANLAPRLDLSVTPQVVSPAGLPGVYPQPGDILTLSLSLNSSGPRAVDSLLELCLPDFLINLSGGQMTGSRTPAAQPAPSCTNGLAWDFGGVYTLQRWERAQTTIQVTVDPLLTSSVSGPVTARLPYLDYQDEPQELTSQVRAAVDLENPELAFGYPTDGMILGGGIYHVIIGGSSSDATTWVTHVEVDLPGLGTTPATGTGPWLLDWSLPADGLYLLAARAYDHFNHVSPDTVINVLVDNTPPTVSTSLVDGQYVSAELGQNVIEIQVQGSASDATAGLQRVEFSLDDKPWKEAWVESGPTAYNVSWQASWELPNESSSQGHHTLRMRAFDRATNMSLVLTREILVDVLPPSSMLTDHTFVFAPPSVRTGETISLRGIGNEAGYLPDPLRPVELIGKLDALEDATLWIDLPSVAENDGGVNITWIGDFNGDRLADFLVGLPSGLDGAGRVAVVYGKAGDWPAPPDAASLADSRTSFMGLPGAGIGARIAPAGDVNGDNLYDFLVGDPSSGRIFLIFGRPGALGQEQVLDGKSTKWSSLIVPGDATVGSWFAPAGDVNGDGFDDLLTGAPGVSKAYLLLGKDGGWEEEIDLTIHAAASLAYPAGAPLSGVSDLDGDHYDDFAVSSGSTVYLFMGSPDLQSRALVHLPLSAAASVFTSTTANPAILAAGDVSGDGLPDFLYKDGTAPRLVLGSTSRAWGSRSISGIYPAASGLLAAPGDVNNDGINDLLIGNAVQDAYLFLGAPSLAVTSQTPAVAATLKAVGAAASAFFGYGSDLNSDGSSDLLLLPYAPDGFDAPGSYGSAPYIPMSSLPVAASGEHFTASGSLPIPEINALPAPLAATVRVVDDDGCASCYTSIQAAVLAALAGDTIQVLPGVYAPFQVTKNNLTITGIHPDAVFIDGAGASYAIQVQNVTGIRLANLTLRNAQRALWLNNSGVGGYSDATKLIRLEKTLIHSFSQHAVWMDRVSTLELKEVTISGAGGHIQVDGPADPAMNSSWSTLGGPTPPALSTGGDLFAYGSYLYLVRGGGSPFIDQYNTVTNTPIAITGPAPYSGVATTIADPNGTLYTFQVQSYQNQHFYRLDGTTWTELADLTHGAAYPNNWLGEGASLVSAPSGQIYLMPGGGQNFFFIYYPATSYMPTGYWNYHSSLPGPVGVGGTIISVGDQFYALAGGNTGSFYRFDIQSGTWATLTAMPNPYNPSVTATVGAGAALAWDGANDIYATTGGNGKGFLRYHIPSNTWTVLGDSLSSTTGDDDTPLPVNAGGGLARIGSSIYGAPGGGIAALWRYSPVGTLPKKLILNKVAFVGPENQTAVQWLNLDLNNLPADFLLDGDENEWIGGPATVFSPRPLDMPKHCSTTTATDVPQHYAYFDASVASQLVSTHPGHIMDLNLLNISIYMNPGDTELFLTSPDGATYEMAPYMCGVAQDDRYFSLDDQAISGLSLSNYCDNTSFDGDTFRPNGAPLSSFTGKYSAGNWRLTMHDTYGWGYLTLNGWSVETCTGAWVTTYDQAQFVDPARNVYRLDAGSKLAAGYHTYHPDVTVAASGGDYTQIQAAILSGANQITIQPGVYPQSFYIISGVDIAGSGAELTHIQPPAGTTPTALITAEGVQGASLSGVTLTGSAETDGLSVEHVDHLRFFRSILRNLRTAIHNHGSGSHLEVYNNTLVGSQDGYLSSGCASVDVRNTVFAEHSSAGLSYEACAPVQLHTYNDFWANASDLSPLEPGPGEIFMDPLFLAPIEHNYRTPPGSPLGDAGNPNDPTPPGTGERVDIGYLEQGRASVYVDDDYCASCTNDYLTFGVDAFSTVQAGLDRVAELIATLGAAPKEPFMVGVGPGTYAEAVRVPSYTHLVGSGADVTTLTSQTDSVVRFSESVQSSVSGFTLRDAGMRENWPVVNADSAYTFNQRSALALDSQDYPNLAYVGSDYVIKFARFNGQDWQTETVPNSACGTSYYMDDVSIDLDPAGWPHISYRCDDNDLDYLRYAYKDASGWHVSNVDYSYPGYYSSTGFCFMESSIKVGSDGIPHISYYDSRSGLRYASKNGDAWTIEEVDSTGRYTALELDDQNQPHISYNDWVGGNLKYAYKDASGWHVTLVDGSPNNDGHFSDIALDASGRPHISYIDWTAFDLKYAAWDGSSWKIQVVSSEYVFNETGIRVAPDGRVHIAYVASGTLKYAISSETGWLFQTLTSNGGGLSMAMDGDGRSHISFNNGNAIGYTHFLGDPGQNAGVEVSASSNNISIHHNRILHNRVGIKFSGQATGTASFNTIADSRDAAIRSQDAGSWGWIENNILSGYGAGFNTQNGSTLLHDYNLLAGGGTNYLDEAGTGLYPAAHELQVSSALFQNPAAGNYHLQQVSAAVDSASPFADAPAGGGQRADMGYSELLAAPVVVLPGKENVSSTTGYSAVRQIETGIVRLADASQPVTATLPTTWTLPPLYPSDKPLAFWQVDFTPSTDGLYRVYSRASDQVDNQENYPAAWYEGAFIADGTPPLVAWTPPVPGQVSGPFALSASVSDYAAGEFSVETVEFILTGDSGELRFPGTWSPQPWDPAAQEARSFTAWITLPLGTYTLKAAATDRAGNLGESESKTLTVSSPSLPPGPSSLLAVLPGDDLVAPTLDISLPQPGDVYSGTVTFQGTTTDLAGSGLAGVEVSLDGGVSWLPATLTDSNWSLTWDPPAGNDHVTYPTRVLARDLAGNQTVAELTFAVDNVAPSGFELRPVDPPVGTRLGAFTGLEISWERPADGSGVVQVLAAVDQNPETIPSEPVAGNEFIANLNRNGEWYLHFMIQDGLGNRFLRHYGPWYMEDPSVACGERIQYIDLDGTLDTYHAEWLPVEKLDDAEETGITQSLYVTWDASQLVLSWQGAWWDGDGSLWAYLDTAPGGSDQALLGDVQLPFAADLAIQVEELGEGALWQYNGAWTSSPLTFAHGLGGEIEIAIPLQATSLPALGLAAFALDENGLPWTVFPTTNRLPTAGETLVLTSAYHWDGLCGITAPNLGQPSAPSLRLSISSPQPSDNFYGPGQTLEYLITVENWEDSEVQDAQLSLTPSPGLSLTSLTGAACVDCPAGEAAWTVTLPALSAGASTTIDLFALLADDLSAYTGATLSADAPASSLHGVQLEHRLDGIRPTIAANPLPANAIATGSQNLAGTADDGEGAGIGRVEVLPDGSAEWLTAEGGETWNAAVNIPLADTVSFRLRAVDAVGNFSEELEISLIVDSTPPVASMDLPALLGAQPYAEILGTAQDPAPAGAHVILVEVQIDDETSPWRPASIYQPESGSEATWQFTWDLPRDDYQPHQLRFRATDAAGNVSAPSEWQSTMVDTISPQVAAAQELLEIEIAGYTSAAQPGPAVLTGSAEDPGGIGSLGVWVYTSQGQAYFESVPVEAGSFAYSPLFSQPISGALSLYLQVKDVAGNTTLLGPYALTLVDEPLAGLDLDGPDQAWLYALQPFTATLSAGTNYTATWDFGDGSPLLVSNHFLTETLTAEHAFQAPGDYPVKLRLENSRNALEATQLVKVDDQPVGAPLLDEDFSQAFPPPGWQRYTATPGGSGWVVSDTLYHSPAQAAFHADSFGAQDAWLVTPALIPSEGSRLTFWQYENFYRAYFRHSVWVSAGSANPKEGDYVLLAELGPGTEDTWSQVDLSLRAYAGQAVYLAFRYEGEYADEWAIDDVLITSDLWVTSDSPTQPGATTTLTATVGSGTNVVFTWDFGDGSPAASRPHSAFDRRDVITHTFAAPGVYTTTLTASNAYNSVTTTHTVLVQSEIDGLSVASSAPTTLGETTYLTATLAGGSAAAFTWAFGDGAAGTGPTPQHTYASPGDYTVVVTASNALSQQVAELIVQVDEGLAGLSLETSSPTRFGASTWLTATLASGSRAALTWDFGDGILLYGPDTGLEVQHTYLTPGNYTVTLTATNSLGSLAAQSLVYAHAPIGAPLLFEDFESGVFPPAGWTLFNTRTLSGWESTQARAHSPLHSAYHPDAYGEHDSWLISPAVTPQAGSRLQFWQSENFSAYYQQHSIWVSTGSPHPKDGDFILLAELGPGAEDAWEEISLELESYAGQALYLAFRYQGSDSDQWYLDDIQVTAPLVASSSSPTYLGTPTVFTAAVQTGAPVEYTWDFGDGTSGSGSSPSHIYPSGGMYTATVTASNALSTASTSTQVEILAADLALQVVLDPAEPVAGMPVTVTLTITNSGPSPATNPELAISLPVGLEPLSVPTGCTVEAELSCNLSDLNPGESTQISLPARLLVDARSPMALTAQVAALEPDPFPADNTARLDLPVLAQVDLQLAGTGAASAIAGADFTSIFTVTNTGPSSATNVALAVALPGHTILVAAHAGQGSCGTSVDPLVCTLGRLDPLEQATLILTLRSDPDLTGTVSIPAQAFAAETELVPADNAFTIATPLTWQADLALEMSASPTVVVAGLPFTYTLSVRNLGPSVSTGSVVTVTLPAEVHLDGAAAGCTESSGDVVCLLESLALSGIQTVHLPARLDPSAGGDVAAAAMLAGLDPDPVLTNNAARAALLAAAEADLQLSLAIDPVPAIAGDSLTYRLSAYNAGPSDATATVLTATLPASFSLTGFAPDQGMCSLEGSLVRCELGRHPAGETLQVLVSGTLSPTLPHGAWVSAVAAIRSAALDRLPENNLAEDSTIVLTIADLLLQKVASPAVLAAGETTVYTLTVTNYRPSDANGVILSDRLPDGLTFNAWIHDPGGCALDGRDLRCELDSLPAGASRTVSFSARLDTGLSGTLTNTAEVTSLDPDPDPDNNTASAVLTVTRVADLGVHFSSLAPTVLPGGVVTYTIGAANHGPSLATGVVLTGTLPAGSSLQSFSIPTGVHCEQVEQELRCQLGTLEVGQRITLTHTLAAPLKSGDLSYKVEITGLEADRVPGNNTAVMTGAVRTLVDLCADAFEGDPLTCPWTVEAFSATPTGRNFLGKFGTGLAETTLQFTDLPAHNRVILTFDLYIIHSWDGNNPTGALDTSGDPIGPDLWELRLGTGQTLLHTTFSNWMHQPQAYPGAYPSGSYPFASRAVEVDSLGYTYAGEPMDAVYHFVVQFSHTDPDLEILFASLGLQSLLDESWGLDNVSVKLSSEGPVYLPLVHR